MRKSPECPFRLSALIVAAAIFGPAHANAETTIFECAGMQRAFDRAAHVKLPATSYTRKFAFDENDKSIFEYVDQKWITLDSDAEVDKADISARYSHDYPDGRIDIIFEYNRINNSLVYILDIDEKPGAFFNARCQIEAARSGRD